MLLKPAPPFDFDPTVGYQASSQSYYGDSLLREGTYRRLLEINGKLILVSARSTGSVERPELEVEVLGEDVSRTDALPASEKRASMLGTGTELREYYTLAQGDPDMAFITRELYGLRIPRTGSIFEALVTSITSQQIAFNVASLIRNLLVKTYGRSLSVEGHAYYACPSPESLLEAGIDGLRRIELSTRKAEYILQIASDVSCGSPGLESIHSLPDQELEERVMNLRGVDKWTWQRLQIRALGRPDAFPAGDLALRRIVSHRYFGGRSISEVEAEEFSRRFVPIPVADCRLPVRRCPKGATG